jgi:hypothetical protein
LWLQDGIGHAESIAAEMDMIEKDVIKRSKHFSVTCTDFYLKAVEMAGFLRTQVERFPALTRFNKQVELEMLMFQKFLDELEELELSHYLTKLSMVSEVNRPNCDPGKPRIK